MSWGRHLATTFSRCAQCPLVCTTSSAWALLSCISVAVVVSSEGGRSCFGYPFVSGRSRPGLSAMEVVVFPRTLERHIKSAFNLALRGSRVESIFLPQSNNGRLAPRPRSRPLQLSWSPVTLREYFGGTRSGFGRGYDSIELGCLDIYMLRNPIGAT